jgi:hypothetical protein
MVETGELSTAERGFYDHGKYPFEFDVLFEEEDSPTGFGYIDVMKSPQLYIDKLDQVILKVAARRRKVFLRADGTINEAEYTDDSKDIVHVPQGAMSVADSVYFEPVMPIPPILETIRQNKIQELKDTSGNRDFSQGSTASGVTAASAIAALQEAGSKLSRDMIKSSYLSHVNICYLCIELIRQFYKQEREFRITNSMGGMEFIKFSGEQIAPKPLGNDFGQDMGTGVPIFDIEVTAQKSSPFSTAAQNERAKEMYSMGFFSPANADQALATLEMMQFDGIEAVRKRISENGTMYQQIQQLSSVIVQMATQLDAVSGTQDAPGIAQTLGQQLGGQAPGQGQASSGEVQTNALGSAVSQSKNSTAAGARTKAMNNATPRA